MVHLGVDLGGTNIKVGVTDDGGMLLGKLSAPTGLPRPAQAVCESIVAAARQLLEREGLGFDRITDVGVVAPGTVNPQTGLVAYSTNLDWRDFALREYIESLLPSGIPVYVENDANGAAVGEYMAGSARGADSVAVITIGTGLGSGVILDHRIIEGHYCGGGEFGHMVIKFGGRPCNCGRRGCFEAYASATGLINLTRDEMARSPGSAMHEIAKGRGKVSGRTAFDAMRMGDEAGARVVDLFISYLACGVTNIVNGLQPQVICIGGGISNEGDALLIPLREKVAREVYGGPHRPTTELRICTLGNDAGMIGAAMLGRMGRG